MKAVATARDAIMSKVRVNVRDGAVVPPGHDAERAETVRARLAACARNLVPARATDKPVDELVPILGHWLTLAGGDLIEVAAFGDVPAAVAGYLRRHGAPLRVRHGADGMLAGIPWTSEEQLVVEHGHAGPSDTASVTRALAAVAETGTVVVASGPANPVTLSFLPEINIVIVNRGDVVGPLEDAVARVREVVKPLGSGLPRTLNLISGPSRSADIGGIPVLGAHGPKRLAVIVVG